MINPDVGWTRMFHSNVPRNHTGDLTIPWWPREMLREKQAPVAPIYRRLGYRRKHRKRSWPAQCVIGKPLSVQGT